MIPERPTVRTQCICRNGGKPDENGWIFTNAACIVHRPHRPWGGVPSPRLPSPDERAEAEAYLAAHANTAKRGKDIPTSRPPTAVERLELEQAAATRRAFELRERARNATWKRRHRT